MLKQSIQNISIIGGGNVATQLGKHLLVQGLNIVQLIVRAEKTAYKDLAADLNAELCTDYAHICAEIDLLIIAVSDNAIASVAAAISENKALKHILLVHTSGATPMTILAPFAQRYGVFYPLQTFSKMRHLNMHTVPICVDAILEVDKAILLELGQKLSGQVAIMSDSQRAYLHVGAVLVNNFTNHLFALAQDFTAKHHTPFSILKPLIIETIEKLEYMPAKAAQTGPAKRQDENTIQRHLELIGEDKDLAQLYKIISESIAKYHLS